jgi:hypothetical protein
MDPHQVWSSKSISTGHHGATTPLFNQQIWAWSHPEAPFWWENTNNHRHNTTHGSCHGEIRILHVLTAGNNLHGSSDDAPVGDGKKYWLVVVQLFFFCCIVVVFCWHHIILVHRFRRLHVIGWRHVCWLRVKLLSWLPTSALVWRFPNCRRNQSNERTVMPHITSYWQSPSNVAGRNGRFLYMDDFFLSTHVIGDGWCQYLSVVDTCRISSNLVGWLA